ncbi:MAG: hypothetical protein ACI9KE_000690 [Polyangiales bacterium]|jgi:hypothetical protein
MNGHQGFTLIVAFAAMAACSEGFSVGDQDASVDAAANDSSQRTDASQLDAAVDVAALVDASSENACPAPWLVTLVRGADAVQLWRFALAADGSFRRCIPTQPLEVPADARDAELIDATTAIVAGLDGVTLVDVVSGEQLDSFPPPPGEFTEVQTFAFGSSSRLGAVAWGGGDGDGRLDSYTRLAAYPRGGEELTLVLPEVGFCRAHVRVSSYRAELAATSFISCSEVFAFNPITGGRIEDENLPQNIGGEVFHTLPDGTSAGADTLAVVLQGPDQTRQVNNPCAGTELEAAPDPSNSGAAFLRCDNRLMRYDFDDDELSNIVGGAVEELGLEVLSLGVAVAPE